MFTVCGSRAQSQAGPLASEASTKPCSSSTCPRPPSRAPASPVGINEMPCLPSHYRFCSLLELPLGTRLCICIWHDKRAIYCSAWLETAPAEERKGAFLKQDVYPLSNHGREQARSANISQKAIHQMSLTFSCFIPACFFLFHPPLHSLVVVH